MFKSNKGFTLIELMIVIAIIGIIFAIGSTLFKDKNTIDKISQNTNLISEFIERTDNELVDRSAEKLMTFLYRDGSGIDAQCKKSKFIEKYDGWDCLVRAESNGQTIIKNMKCKPNIDSNEIECELIEDNK